MGLMQRRKGKSYERTIAIKLRAKWPEAVVRRASQADRAHESDVFVKGACPKQARQVWWELQDSRKPTPLAKLEQAERDIAERCPGEERHAVVVWHQYGCRDSQATMRLVTLAHVASFTYGGFKPQSDLVVTVDFDDLLAVMP